MHPKHIAFILDGNRRWAKDKSLGIIKGHKAGYSRIKDIVKYSVNTDIEYISLYAFSTENWNRPKIEVKMLLNLFEEVLTKEIDTLVNEGIKIVHIGRKDRLPKKLIDIIQDIEYKSKDNKKLTLLLGIDYGGKDDILRAVNKLFNNRSNNFNKDINLEDLEDYMDLSRIPDPELMIRTGDEHRISNFMLWNLAYTELMFIEKKLPDFTVDDFIESLEKYSNRQRRFGK